MLKVEIEGESKGATSSDGVKEEVPGCWTKYRGILLSAFAHLCFSLTFLIVKCLHGYHPVTVFVWRQSAIFLPTIPIFFYLKFTSRDKTGIFSSVFPLSTRESKILFLCLIFRGIIAATANLLQVYALKYLSVGDSAIFTFSSPVFVVVLATCFLGEKCGFVSSAVAVLTFCGIALIVRPPILTGETKFDMDNLTGVLLAFAGLILIAMVTILLRRMRKIHWVLNLGAFGLLGLVESLIVAGGMGVLELPAGTRDSLLTYLALPCTVYLGQLSILMALKYEQAGPVSLVGTLGVLFSFLLQFAVFGIPPDVYSAIGGTIVILGVGVITWKKYVKELPLGDGKRKTFKFLLY